MDTWDSESDNMTDSSIKAHCDAIATICSSVTGMTSTFGTAPVKIDSGQLPAQYTFTGQSVVRQGSSSMGSDFLYSVRTYRIQVAVVPIGQATPDVRESRCQPLIDAVFYELSRFPSLGNLAGVQKSQVLGDSGIVVLPEWGAKFIGFELRFEVEYIMARDFGPGE